MKQEPPRITPANWQVSRVVALGYYDGPTEGMFELANDLGVYWFRAMAMDIDRETRVLKLSELTPRHFDDIVLAIASILGPPK